MADGQACRRKGPHGGVSLIRARLSKTWSGKPDPPVLPSRCAPEGVLRSSRAGDGRRSACIPKDAALRRLWPRTNLCCPRGGIQPAVLDRPKQAPTSLHSWLRVRLQAQGSLLAATTSGEHEVQAPDGSGTRATSHSGRSKLLPGRVEPVQHRRAQGPLAPETGPGEGSHPRAVSGAGRSALKGWQATSGDASCPLIPTGRSPKGPETRRRLDALAPVSTTHTRPRARCRGSKPPLRCALWPVRRTRHKV